MSVSYRPVMWNRNKLVYDAVLVLGVAAYLLAFFQLAPLWIDHTSSTTPNIVRMRAFGSCAFLMLTVILCIGPLARLDRRFLPLLYNRRHFGVLCFIVALTHAREVAAFYHGFSPTDPWVSILGTNTAYGSFLGFPFEILGLTALVILFVMAVTSHDFWLSFLTPKVWKALHMGVYLAYGAAVMHVVLGAMQGDRGVAFAVVVALCFGLVISLHVAAGRREWAKDREGAAAPADDGPWVHAGRVADVPVDRGIVVPLAGGERVAIFRYGDRLSALSNLCAHQNGPLGEGRIVDGCVTCPWHGFQYRPEDGCSPPPFTEKVPTYRLKLDGDRILLDPRALPAGTPVDPVHVPESV